jgi:hypothetical protein
MRSARFSLEFDRGTRGGVSTGSPRFSFGVRSCQFYRRGRNISCPDGESSWGASGRGWRGRIAKKYNARVVRDVFRECFETVADSSRVILGRFSVKSHRCRSRSIALRSSHPRSSIGVSAQILPNFLRDSQTNIDENPKSSQ